MENLTVKISVVYHLIYDRYIATVGGAFTERTIIMENGADLSKVIKEGYGISIDYRPGTRSFYIPPENRF